MQLLLSEAQRTTRSPMAAIVSVAVHAGAVIVLALTGQQVVNTVRVLIEETVRYLYPAPRDIGAQRPGQESESAFRAQRGFGMNPTLLTDHASGSGQAAGLAHAGALFTPDPSSAETADPGIGDNALSIVEVDSVAFVDPTSVAPDYPQALAQRRVEGGASFRFVVDSTGLIDMSTVRVMSATHKLFAQAVVDAMPKMKYRPARVGSHAVRLLVEQAFSFKLQRVKANIS